MRLELTGRHVANTTAVRKAVDRRLARVARMLNDNIVSVQVVITREQSRTHVDLTLHARGDHFLHSAATGRDLPTAIGAATEKLEHQAQRLKSRWTKRKGQSGSATKARSAVPRPERVRCAFGTGTVTAGGESKRAVRARCYAVKPMLVDDAAPEIGRVPVQKRRDRHD